MTEHQWDQKLNIETAGRDAIGSDEYRYPYEPTPYSVLQRLTDSGWISREHKLVDFGCGLGRVGFFLHHTVGCACVGVEHDPRIYEKAIRNRERYLHGTGVEFVCLRAEQYEIGAVDACYFFNPFSLALLQSVYGNLRMSWYENPRTLRLFFYYPSDEYRAFLMTRPELTVLAELDCRDLFPGSDSRETILILELS